MLVVPLKVTKKYNIGSPLALWIDSTQCSSASSVTAVAGPRPTQSNGDIRTGTKNTNEPGEEKINSKSHRSSSSSSLSSSTSEKRKTTTGLAATAATATAVPDFTSWEVREDLSRLTSLRNALTSAIQSSNGHAVAIDNEALQIGMEYYAALVQCENYNFPIRDGIATELQLSWDCALEFDAEMTAASAASAPTSRSNIRYERACVLFNIAALHSYLASQEDGTDKPGLDRAMKRYKVAAALFKHLREKVMTGLTNTNGGGGRERTDKGNDENVVVDNDDDNNNVQDDDRNTNSTSRPLDIDLSEQALRLCENLMLAQGQRCAYNAAAIPRRSRPMHLLLSKVAMGAAELYDSVYESSLDAILREGIPNTSERWGSHARAVAARFRAAAEFHEGESAHDKSEWGREVARLEKAENMCRQAVRYAERAVASAAAVSPSSADGVLQSTEALLDELESLKRTVTKRRAEAERENTHVHQSDVPEIHDLPKIRGQNLMATRVSLPPELHPDNLDPPMFRSLLCPRAREAARQFRLQMSSLLERTMEAVKDETESAKMALAEVNLPQALAAYDASVREGGGVPPDLWEKVQNIQEDGVVEKLKQELWDLRDTSEMARRTASELAKQLDSDYELDRLFREENPNFEGHSAEEVQQIVRRNLKSCLEWLDNARGGDAVLLGMLETFETDPKFKLLHYSKGQLDVLIPAQTGPAVDTSDLASSLVELSSLLRERERILNALRKEVKDYDIWSKLKEVDDDGSDDRDDVIGKYDRVVELAIESFRGLILDIQVNLDKQPGLMERILYENTLFLEAKENAQSSSSSGEGCINMLEEAIETIERVQKQLREGRNFYNVVTPRLEQLQQSVSDISLRLTVERCEYEDNKKTMEILKRDEDLAKRLAASNTGGGGSGPMPGLETNDDAAIAADMARRFEEEETERRRSQRGGLDGIRADGSSHDILSSTSGRPDRMQPTAGNSPMDMQLNEERIRNPDAPGPTSTRRPPFRPESLDPSLSRSDRSVDMNSNHGGVNGNGGGGSDIPVPRDSIEHGPTHTRRSTELAPGQPGIYSVANDEVPQVRVDDTKVALLVSMEFEHDRVVRALQKYDNNVEQALNDLLSC